MIAQLFWKMKMKLTIDLVPYEFLKEGDWWRCEDFTAFDLSIPEHYRNRTDTPTGVKVNDTILDIEHDGKLIEIKVYGGLSNDEEEEIIETAFSVYYDAFREIGWEAMECYE